MPALRDLQLAFAAGLHFGDDAAVSAHIVEGAFTAAERLRIYRNSCRSTLVEAVRLTYPAVDRLVGRDFFDAAAETFLLERGLPRSGYLNEHGAEFADFLSAYPGATALRYLPDVARFEWALSEAANAIDAPVLDASTLLAVDAAKHGRLCFDAHPSVRLLDLDFPADRIADAVLSGDEQAMAAVDLASGPVWLVVHRGPNGVEASRLAPQAYFFVRRLCRGDALARILETAGPDAPALLAEQLTKGRLSGFRIASAGTERTGRET
jgi:hypothetical protein